MFRMTLRACTLLGALMLTPVRADVVVGQSLPLSGILATSGEQIRLGVQVYFDHVNANGGIHGARIRHVVVDDGYKVDETLRLTRELIEREKAVALIGFAGTANVAELLRQGVLAQARIALVAPVTGAQVLRSPFNPNLFHIRAGYADEAEHLVNHLVTIGVHRIGVLYQDDALGQAGLVGVQAAVAKRGLKLVGSASFARGSEKVDEAVRTLRVAEPGAIIMFSINRPTAAFAKRYREAGGAALLLNISIVDPAELTRLAGTAAMHGLGITQVMPYPYAPNLPLVREYQALLKRHAPPGAVPSYLGIEGFVGAKLLVEGLRRAGPRPTSEAVLHALEGLDRFDAGGFFLGYSKTNRIGSRFVDLTVINRDGKLLR